METLTVKNNKMDYPTFKKILFYDNNNLLIFFIMIKYSVVKEAV